MINKEYGLVDFLKSLIRLNNQGIILTILTYIYYLSNTWIVIKVLQLSGACQMSHQTSVNSHQTSVRQVPDMYQTCTRHVPDMYQTCTRHMTDMYQTSTIHVPDIWQTCTRQVPYMYHTCTRCLVGHLTGTWQSFDNHLTGSTRHLSGVWRERWCRANFTVHSQYIFPMCI